MLRRLGMWNRLALVAGILASFALPTWVVYWEAREAREIMDTGFRACMANQHFVKTDSRGQFEYCWDFWHNLAKPAYPTLDNWGIMITGTAIGALLIYGLLWSVIATGKWILRGREVGKEPSPVRATPKDETD